MKYNLNGLLNVDPRCCQHPTDTAVTGKIHDGSLFARGMDILSKYGVERMVLSMCNSDSIRLTRKIAPHIFDMVDEACALFGVNVRPEIFMYRAYDMTMDLIGTDKPVLLVSTGLLGKADEKVLWGMVAARIASMRAGYCELRTIHWFLDREFDVIPELAEEVMKKAFLEWRKYVQFSFDRYALLACGDFNAVMHGILLTQSGFDFYKNTDFTDPNCGYIRQCQEFRRNESAAMGAVKTIITFLDDEVYNANRCLELLKFYQEEYPALMARLKGQEVLEA